MIDTYKHKGLRKLLIQELQAKGIKDERVLNAMEEIPRHLFIDNAFLSHAYENKAFPIGAGQTISHPYTVAFQSELLNIQKGDKILEIGTGCGYQTSVLYLMGAKVYSIERQRSLFVKTKELLPKLKYRAKCFYGDGFKGMPAFAPYDKIIITCGAPFIPEDLKKQLAIGGIMVIPVGDKTQIMHKLTKISETEFEEEIFGEFSFVPMLEKKEKI